MTKILNFALKIKGGGREGGTCEVLRPCHPPPCIAYMQLLKWFCLMKEVVMCNKNLRLKIHSRSTDH